MARAFYIGVDGKARKAKKMYIGVDGKACKVKRIYAGVDGKAKLVFSDVPATGVKLTWGSIQGEEYGSFLNYTNVDNTTIYWYASDVTIVANIEPKDATDSDVTWTMTSGSCKVNRTTYNAPFRFETQGNKCIVCLYCNSKASVTNAYYTCTNNAGYAILTATTKNGVVAKVKITASIENPIDYEGTFQKKNVCRITSVIKV